MDRRRFLTELAPDCTLTCLGAKLAFASKLLSGQEVNQSRSHKFDQPFDRQPTRIQVTELQFRAYIILAKALEKKLVKEELTRILEEPTKEIMFEARKVLRAQMLSDSAVSQEGFSV